MLSAIIITADRRVPGMISPEAIVRSLAALVPGVVQGFIRDLVIAGLAGQPDLDRIADHAGGEVALAPSPDGVIAAALAMARSDWVFVLRAGFAPAPGFFEETPDILTRVRIFRAEPANAWQRLAPGLARPVALIAPRALLVAGLSDIESLARRLKGATTARARFRSVG